MAAYPVSITQYFTPFCLHKDDAIHLPGLVCSWGPSEDLWMNSWGLEDMGTWGTFEDYVYIQLYSHLEMYVVNCMPLNSKWIKYQEICYYIDDGWRFGWHFGCREWRFGGRWMTLWMTLDDVLDDGRMTLDGAGWRWMTIGRRVGWREMMVWMTLDDALDEIVWRFRWRWMTFWMTLDDGLDDIGRRLGWRVTFWTTLDEGLDDADDVLDDVLADG